VRNKTELEVSDLVAILQAADEGIQSRGKAKLGDKTVIDALHPASEAFAAAVDGGASLQAAAWAAIEAAESGRDRVTPLRSKVGRASWVGERTEGKVDPGCAMFVIVLRASAGH
jgi:phosphoenolpyruvate---glycerone phosphotransferase subunit DhaL